jgi:hypothetical protein
MAKLQIPAPPSFLPEKEQAAWKKKYEEGFKQAQVDEPEDEAAQHRAALKEANRMLRVPEIESAAHVKSLPKHLFIKNEEKDGVLKVVTIDGKKYSFDVKVKAAVPAAPAVPPDPPKPPAA